MHTVFLNGKALAAKINARTKRQTQVLNAKGKHPKLVVLAISPDKSNRLYMKMKKRKAQKLGIITKDIIYQNQSDVESKIINEIHRLNQDNTVNGILIQLPLPQNVDSDKINNMILPSKDIDGVTATNQGELMKNHPRLVGNTPLGIMHIVHHYRIPVTGKKALVIGRSSIVGRPLAEMLINHGAEVTILNHYADLRQELTNHYNLIVSATGQANLISLKDAYDLAQTRPYIIDAGENYYHGHLCGDVDSEALAKAGAISGYTPVPGGVGPLTIATLYEQLLDECV